jgi:hypothetical protein
MHRDALRNEAKRIYKQQTKNIAKKNRIPFSEFFKKYKQIKLNKNTTPPVAPPEDDFDLEEFINMNEINDESLEDVV